MRISDWISAVCSSDLLLPLVLLSLAACVSTPPPAAPAPAPLVLVSIDGFRADYLDAGLAPNLARIAGEGVRAQWMNPSYPSLTFPNHYSIVTGLRPDHRSEEHTSELQSLMRISYAVFCLKKKKTTT